MILLEITPEIINENNSSMIYQLIISLIAAIITWVGMVIKNRHEIKKAKIESEENIRKIRVEAEENKKNISEKEKLRDEQMRGFDNKLVKLSMEYLETKKGFEFTQKLKNKIRIISIHIIDFNVELDIKDKYILMNLAREFEDFAIKYYSSDFKNNVFEIFPYLNIEFYSRFEKLLIWADKYKTEIRYLENTGNINTNKPNKNEIKFSEFINRSELNELNIELLNSLLGLESTPIKDELSPDEIIEIFKIHIVKYFKIFIKLIGDWEKLEIVVKKTE